MKTALFSLLALGATISPALAQDADNSHTAGQPVMLSAAQMDNVTAGSHAFLQVNNNEILSRNDVDVNAAANVGVAAAVLGAAGNAQRASANLLPPTP